MILDRKSNRYIEIEGFKSYELTQCIAYEMAIRNPKLKIQINNIVTYYNEIRNAIDDWLDNSKDDDPIVEEKVMKLLSMIYDIEGAPIYIAGYEYKDHEVLGEEIYNIVDYLLGDDFRDLTTSYLHKSSNTTIALKREGLETFRYDRMEGFSITSKVIISEKKNYQEEELNISTPKDLQPYLSKKIKDKEYIESKRTVTTNFKRPLPKVNDLYLNIVDMTIDLNAPINELKAYIEHIKTSMNLNKGMIKATIEIFGEAMEEVDKLGLPKKPTGTTYADIFFIYDYVTIRLNNIEEMNNETKRKYKKREEDEIINNPELNGKDKKIQKLTLKIELAGNLIDTTIKDICKEEELINQINLSGDRTYSLYFIIKPYIEDNKYIDFLR